jgi:hypothetical protein
VILGKCEKKCEKTKRLLSSVTVWPFGMRRKQDPRRFPFHLYIKINIFYERQRRADLPGEKWTLGKGRVMARSGKRAIPSVSAFSGYGKSACFALFPLSLLMFLIWTWVILSFLMDSRLRERMGADGRRILRTTTTVEVLGSSEVAGRQGRCRGGTC